jgi:hypothetical protein
MLMNWKLKLTALGAVIICSQLTNAATLVDDRWSDADRTFPAAPTYSENGIDGDADGDLESAWYNAGASVMTATSGNLSKDLNGTSANWTTYFTPEGSEVNLANNGDKLRVTWVFTPSGLGAANTSQNFRFGLVDSIPGNRISTDAAPPSGTAVNPYTGYAVFANMSAGTLANSNPLQIRQRVGNAGSNSILGTTGDWDVAGLTGTTNGATTGNTGFVNGVPYTMVWELTRNGAGIDINLTMSGGAYNGSGTGTIAANDANGNGFIFDTFNVRPSSEAGTASVIDTSLFRVEFFAVPEPGTLSLGLIGLALAVVRRRR